MLINGKTPEQIKAGLRCGKGDVQPKCVDCAYLGYYDEYFEVQHFDCGEIDNDALAYPDGTILTMSAIDMWNRREG